MACIHAGISPAALFINQDTIKKLRTEAKIEVGDDYRDIPASKLAYVFSQARLAIPYLTNKRYPNDWGVSELLKQQLANRRSYLVSKKRLPRRAERKAIRRGQGSGPSSSALPNRDGGSSSDDDEEEEEGDGEAFGGDDD
ncbi:hypothetical protein BDN72DRAFT_964910 [Pluteus cervinus]|uniref:Uncharacterized protein n=1 Tax=Pluteus cervinus TaxID=181527 RepID=A0ACD3A8H4_9AGAR|nr:hypothetical protein BDN72DRAFT_964910 [Pluteus cervinus]